MYMTLFPWQNIVDDKCKTFAALAKPPLLAMPGALCQANGQYARFRNCSISTSTSEVHVLMTRPWLPTILLLVSPGITSARGNLSFASYAAILVESASCNT
jgi:hypothetical protein